MLRLYGVRVMLSHRTPDDIKSSILPTWEKYYFQNEITETVIYEPFCPYKQWWHVIATGWCPGLWALHHLPASFCILSMGSVLHHIILPWYALGALFSLHEYTLHSILGQLLYFLSLWSSLSIIGRDERPFGPTSPHSGSSHSLILEAWHYLPAVCLDLFLTPGCTYPTTPTCDPSSCAVSLPTPPCSSAISTTTLMYYQHLSWSALNPFQMPCITLARSSYTKVSKQHLTPSSGYLKLAGVFSLIFE